VYTDLHPEGPATSRAEQAYADLKRRLLVGEFPLNVRLAEERLAALLGVSRTPIREALSRLHTEGLVVKADDGGHLPAVPDVKGMRQLYEVRTGLELLALRLPAKFGGEHDAEQLERLREEWRELADDSHEPDPTFVLLDESFHVSLAHAAGNAVLTDLLRQVNDRIRVVRMQDFVAPDRITTTIAEHVGIVEAVLLGDTAVAEARVMAHIDLSMVVVEERVAGAITRMASGGKV
jgi:DNA-binding GntR family transcriptional regulator